jgi:hypothetical protein
MPLALIPGSPREGGPPPTAPTIQETELDRILKLIPSELLLIYMAAAPAIADTSWQYCGLVLFGCCTVLAPVILYLDGRSTGQPARWPQYVIRSLTFIVCALAITWPFAGWAEPELRWLRSLSVLAVPFAGALLLRAPEPDDPM